MTDPLLVKVTSNVSCLQNANVGALDKFSLASNQLKTKHCIHRGRVRK